MSNKKDKARWQAIQDNKNRGCLSCVHLKCTSKGNYECYVDKVNYTGSSLIIYPTDAKCGHKGCKSYKKIER